MSPDYINIATGSDQSRSEALLPDALPIAAIESPRRSAVHIPRVTTAAFSRACCRDLPNGLTTATRKPRIASDRQDKEFTGEHQRCRTCRQPTLVAMASI